MDSNSALYLSIALAFIMWGMGLSLVVDDFRRVVKFPKAIFVGLLNQILLLPFVAFILLNIFNVAPEIAIGMMILAACPGGPTTNLLTHLADGDTALSITLTAINSFVTLVTIPFIVNYALIYFANEGQIVQLDIIDTIKTIFLITLIPVILGMIINHYFPSFSEKMSKPVKIISAILLTLIMLGILYGERERVPEYLKQLGIVAFIVNISTMAIGYFSSRLFRLSDKQSITIAIESGIQNGTLAIAIAIGLLGNPTYAIAPVVYSLYMFFTAGGVCLLYTSPSPRD